MSFLKEVLSSVEKTDIESAQRNLPIISEKIVACREEINQYVEDVYLTFSKWPTKNEHLLNLTSNLSSEIQNLQDRITQITVTDIEKKEKDIDDLAMNLECSDIALGIVINLIQINELFINVKDLQERGLYMQAGKELIRAIECIENIPEDEITDAIETLKDKIQIKRAALIEKVSEVFEDNVRTSTIKNGIIRTNTIKICDSDSLAHSLQMLIEFHAVNIPLAKLSKFIITEICQPIITSFTDLKIENEGNSHSLMLAVKKPKGKIPYKDVFSKLLEVFSFLQFNFDYEIGRFKTITYLGDQIKYDLTEMILNECLSDALPSKDADCEKYRGVISDIKVFQSKLVVLKIFDEHSNPILDYANNMEVLFVNKQCHEYMTIAINAMKKDLHDVVDVGMRDDAGNPLTTDQFPECSISRSTIEILTLVQEMLQIAEKEADLSAARMICTVQSIFYQYGTIVQASHQRLLQSIPQQIALFRNNCMYIAHQLIQLNEVYSNKFSPVALPTPPLFPDQAHQLKMLGGDIFLSYVEEQLKGMECTLHEYQFNIEHVSGRLHLETDKCLRQCMRQNEILKTVWLKVLPHSVYNKTLGYLLNALCKKLVEVVVAAEDIPLKNAEMLIELYKVVLIRGPKLFPDSHEICLYVETWQKLNDLVFILGGTLVEICDRWAKGKGPLTLSFTAEEVKSLIKALFQNTERRSAALKTIHNET